MELNLLRTKQDIHNADVIVFKAAFLIKNWSQLVSVAPKWPKQEVALDLKCDSRHRELQGSKTWGHYAPLRSGSPHLSWRRPRSVSWRWPWPHPRSCSSGRRASERLRPPPEHLPHWPPPWPGHKLPRWSAAPVGQKGGGESEASDHRCETTQSGHISDPLNGSQHHQTPLTNRLILRVDAGGETYQTLWNCYNKF